jgi:DNA-binding LacI/PurR family transcriptional regulator
MTLDQIADELGVSKSTVSRALSGKGRIGVETRDRIRTYVRQNEIAFENRTCKEIISKKIAVLIPSDVYVAATQYFYESLLGISEAADARGFEVLITTGTENELTGIVALIEKENIDGVVLMRSLVKDHILDYLHYKGVPVAVMGSCEYEDVIQADVDNKGASREMGRLLYSFGYRKFGLIISSMEYRVNRDRKEGFLNGIQSPVKENNTVCSCYDTEQIDDFISDIREKGLDCIVCGDDAICSRVMSKVQAAGYRVPEEIAVVSLYDSMNLQCFSPAITSITVKTKQWGFSLCLQLLDRLSQKNYKNNHTVEYEISIRKSTLNYQITENEK